MTNNVSDYGREIKVIRELLELTQTELGRLLGITQNSVMRYENGMRKVPEPTIRFARQLVHMRQTSREENDIEN